MKWIVFTLLVTVLFWETGYIFTQGTTSGSGSPWQRLPAPPQRAVHIAYLDGFQVVIESADQTLYDCSWLGDKVCWQPIKREQFEGGYAKLWQPTTQLAPPELPSVTEIKYVNDSSPADFVILAAAAIQDDGTVQVWHVSHSWIEYLVAFGLQLCAGAAGLVASVFLALIVRAWPKKKRPAGVLPRPQLVAPASERTGPG